MKVPKLFIISALLGLWFWSTAYAEETAQSCSSAHVESAITACIADGACNTVHIPAGECTWYQGDRIAIDVYAVCGAL